MGKYAYSIDSYADGRDYRQLFSECFITPTRFFVKTTLFSNRNYANIGGSTVYEACESFYSKRYNF